MIAGKKILAVVPARGGSKGIHRKNLQMINNQTLLEIAFAEAKKSKFIDRFILSSDDTEICEHVKNLGFDVPFVRPSELATDQATSVDVALHALNQCPGFDILVWLQPTSPLRLANDIDMCIRVFSEKKFSSLISVSEMRESPYWAFKRDTKTDTLTRFIEEKQIPSRRQDLPSLVVPNGAVYVRDIAHFLQHRDFMSAPLGSVVMNEKTSLDIDTPLDLEWARFLAKP